MYFGSWNKKAKSQFKKRDTTSARENQIKDVALEQSEHGEADGKLRFS